MCTKYRAYPVNIHNLFFSHRKGYSSHLEYVEITLKLKKNATKCPLIITLIINKIIQKI